MTAVPHTAGIRASAGRRAQQPLRDSQREYAWQHPPSAIAALRLLVARTSRAAWGWYRQLE